MKVSFDFDNTLDQQEVQDFAMILINKGVDVWIHTARFPESEFRPKWNDDIYKVADELGIPIKNIVLTQMSDKFIFIRDKNFIWHLDDNSNECINITNHSDCIGVNYSSYNNKWLNICTKIIRREKLKLLS